ncbi:MAG: nucleotidyltransferase domain-containing protein [Bacteroidales bacterium]|nr:nucleotidyltransferase domain-containing protein [Bacteroidales bacterium]
MSTETMTRIIAEYFKTQPVLKAWLFGSYARGEERPDSDVDILVEYDNPDHISLLTISRMMGGLEKAISKKVDLVENGCLLPFALESVNRDKQLIYERAC